MRLLLITHEFSMTGAALALYRVGAHLAGQGHEVTVLGSRDTDGPLLEPFRRAGARIIFELASAPFDLAIANTLLAAPVLLRVAAHVRTLWWIHEGEVGRNMLLQRPAWAPLFHQVSHLLFPTSYLPDHIYRSFLYDLPPEKISVLTNGIEPAPPVTPVPRKKRLRVVCVGTVYPRKRQGDLVRAVASLGRDDVECVLVGKVEAPLDPPAQQLVAAQAGRYLLVGETDNVTAHAWYAGSDVFCLPSESEALGLAPLEAGLHKLPVILSDLPVYQGIWRHGRNCLMHPVGDVQLLAWSLRMLLEDAGLRTRLGQAASEGAARFGSQDFLTRLELLLRRLIA